MSWCKICGQYMTNPDTHKCSPAFELRREEHGDDDWTTVYANYEQEAAEKWAEKDDSYSSAYRIVGGETVTVLVRRKGETAIIKFVVTGTTVPEYHADKVA